MTSPQPYTLFRHIRRLAAAGATSQRSDMQLLQQFIAECDEDAFTTLVQRHGAMVLGVSRSVLHQQQDAEDVLQATFLVLARKGHTIRQHESLGSWLHRVAFRMAMKVKVQSRRQRDREQAHASPDATQSVDDLSLKELRAILHEEMNGLSDKYRGALLLCYWEGKTRDQAAEQVGMSAGAFKKCLERARKLLSGRLVRRGLVPSAAFLAMLFSDCGAEAAISGALTKTTTQAALAFAVGQRAGVSASAALLAEGAIQTMTATKWLTTLFAMLLISGLTAGVGLASYCLLQKAPTGEQFEADPAGELQPIGVAKAGESKEPLIGIWRIQMANESGKPIPAELKTLIRIHFTKDGTFIMGIPEEVAKELRTPGPTTIGKYEAVGGNKIDFKFENKNAGLGIFEFDGKDRLALCISEDGKRPTDFKAEKGTRVILFDLVRAKPGEEKPSTKDIAAGKDLKKLAEAAARTRSVNNLKQIALAMHNYHSVENAFPAHAIYSKDGKTPLLSWRVAILPYIEQQQLYQQFKLDEPWDSKHNIKLVEKIPQIYVMPEPTKAKKGETFYQVLTGPDTVFNGSKKMQINNIADGTSSTILVVETKNPIVWTRPDDMALPKDPAVRLALGGRFNGGFNVAMCDGSVRFLTNDITTQKLRALITASAGD